MRPSLPSLACACLLLCASAWAQSPGGTFNRPPAGVEEALRARVTAFYHDQMEGSFRRAEAYVCADSREIYYSADKRRWRSQEILKVTFESDFASARVLTSLGTQLNTPTGALPSYYPMLTTWKLESGLWCQFLSATPNQEVATAFGTMHPGPGKQAPLPSAKAPRPDVASVQAMVKVSKTELSLKSYEQSSDEVDIINGLPGVVHVEVEGTLPPGLRWSLSHNDLSQGDNASLRVTYSPPEKSAKPPLTLTLRMEPIGQTVLLRVNFAVEDAKKQSPPPALPSIR